MTASTRVKLAGYGLNDIVPAADMQALQVQSAGAIRRASTASGSINYPLIVAGGSEMHGVNTVWWDGKLYTTNGASGEGYTVHFALDRLPDGHVLDYVGMSILPNGDHSVVPERVPAIMLLAIDTDGVVTTLGTAACGATPGSSPTDYESGFSLDIVDIAHTINLATYRYMIVMLTESGANSVLYCRIKSLLVGVSVNTAEGGPDFTHWLKA